MNYDAGVVAAITNYAAKSEEIIDLQKQVSKSLQGVCP